MDTSAFIAAKMARPITHIVRTAYADGSVRVHECRSLGAAENWAVAERRNIGRTLKIRGTDQTVTAIRVEIETL